MPATGDEASQGEGGGAWEPVHGLQQERRVGDGPHRQGAAGQVCALQYVVIYVVEVSLAGQQLQRQALVGGSDPVRRRQPGPNVADRVVDRCVHARLSGREGIAEASHVAV